VAGRTCTVHVYRTCPRSLATTANGAQVGQDLNAAMREPQGPAHGSIREQSNRTA
jgi:hypothetical protein